LVAGTLAGLSLRDLEYAVAIRRLGHFGRAAEFCNVSQPTLSEQVRKLEALLGVALFERTRRGVETTARGAVLLARAERVLAEAHGLLDATRAVAAPLTGALALGAIETLGPYYLPRMLRQLRPRFPALKLLLSESRTALLLEALHRSELDLALLALPAADDGLAIAPLFFEPFHLVCPAGHKLEALPRLHLDDLDGEDLLLLEEGHCLRDQALSLCGSSRRSGQTRHATSLETLWHMIAAAEGYSLLPVLALQGRDELATLVSCRELADPQVGRRIGLAWRASDPRGTEFMTLAASLRETTPEGVTVLA
jgi:LysR family hydrogen peroxide-inducible transcriptional activator